MYARRTYLFQGVTFCSYYTESKLVSLLYADELVIEVDLKWLKMTEYDL